MTLASGTRLGPYEVIAPLGAGGMGEVYRARDARLGREAALKVLPAELSGNRERLARFEQEARAASALNHPNIITIYDIGSSDGTSYVGMEFVEGSTLRELIAEGAIPIRRFLSIASQIAQGLAAAHDAGIIHRDVKPENIMVTSDGRVKLLDFGLAKLATPPSSGGSRSPTASNLTEPGALVGTVSYMSPEQVRGLALDSRTDIFSLGSVLYEMASGARPFRGLTAADVMTEILKSDPPGLPVLAPPALERTVLRCLEKAPLQRFQSARDLAFALDSLSTGSSAPASSPIGPPRARRLSALGIAAAALFAFGAGLLLRPLLSRGGFPAFSRAVRLTSGPARDFAPVLSPDGKWVAYLSDAGGRTDLRVKFLAGGEPATLPLPSGLQIQSRTDVGGLEISPDGTLLFADMGPAGASPSPAGFKSWALPAPLGGAPRQFLANGHAVRFSPDGRRIVFVVAGSTRGDALMVADADGGNQREILKSRGGLHAHWPAWSADGREIYFNYGISGTNAEPTEIDRVPSSGGAAEPVIRTSRRAVFPAPLPDGRGLIYGANPDTADVGLWWRPFRRGEPRRLTLGVGSYVEPRLSADGRSLVATLLELRQSLVSIPVRFDVGAQPRPLTDGYNGDLDPAVSPRTGEIVFSSSRSGNRNLWLVSADGTGARPLTAGNAIDERPAFSPDGQQVAFVSDRAGLRGVWIVPSAGGAPRRLATAQVLDTLSWSPDGKEILFSAPAGDLPGLFLVSTADGRLTRLATPGAAHSGVWSPRGDRIAYLNPVGGGKTQLEFVDPSGRSLPTELPDGGPLLGNGYLAWSPDARRLAAMAVPGSLETVIWIIEPKALEPVRRLAKLSRELRGRGLAWTADGQSILIGNSQSSSNIVLFTTDP
jgi:Tol biopolymer transport system component